MPVGVSPSGSHFDPRPHFFDPRPALLADPATQFSFGSGHDISSVKLGEAAAALDKASSGSGTDRVVASHSGDTVVGGVGDPLTGNSGSRALDALRHADSFVGAAGSETYSIGGGVVHNPIFVASHLLAITPSGLPDPPGGTPHSGAAAHTFLTLGENTNILVKNVTPTVGGGHFK
jgi:hypothetical protein